MRAIGRIRPCACSVSLLDRGIGGFLYAGTGYLHRAVIASPEGAKQSRSDRGLLRHTAPRNDRMGTRLAMTEESLLDEFRGVFHRDAALHGLCDGAAALQTS